MAKHKFLSSSLLVPGVRLRFRIFDPHPAPAAEAAEAAEGDDDSDGEAVDGGGDGEFGAVETTPSFSMQAADLSCFA